MLQSNRINAFRKLVISLYALEKGIFIGMAIGQALPGPSPESLHADVMRTKRYGERSIVMSGVQDSPGQ